jgi:hypothetical protein
MKRILFIFSVFALVFFGCDTSKAVGPETKEPVVENPETETPQDDPVVETPDYSNDTRLTAFGDSESSKWIRYPTKSRQIRYNIAYGDPAAALCTEPGWAYIFYDDGGVIGYAPFPERMDLMQYAVKITVESHNMEFPNAQWGYINVPIPVIPPNTSNDPVLGKWQFAICLDDGTIVDGPYTAEFDFNWQFFKESTARQQLEAYNNEHDQDAHIVWGTDE